MSSTSGSAPGSRNDSPASYYQQNLSFSPESPGGRRRAGSSGPVDRPVFSNAYHHQQHQQGEYNDMMMMTRPSTASPIDRYSADSTSSGYSRGRCPSSETLSQRSSSDPRSEVRTVEYYSQPYDQQQYDSQQQMYQQQQHYQQPRNISPGSRRSLTASDSSLEDASYGYDMMTGDDGRSLSRSNSRREASQNNKPKIHRQKRSLPSEVERSASTDLYSTSNVFQEHVPRSSPLDRSHPSSNTSGALSSGIPRALPSASLLNIDGASSSASGALNLSPGLRHISSDVALTHFDFPPSCHSNHVSPNISPQRRKSDSPLSDYSVGMTGQNHTLVSGGQLSSSPPGDSMSPCSPEFSRSPRQSGDSDLLNLRRFSLFSSHLVIWVLHLKYELKIHVRGLLVKSPESSFSILNDLI